MRAQTLRAMLVALSVGLASCAAPWDPPGLRPYADTLAAVAGHRLFDATPYLLAADGEWIEFFCRFDARRPISVRLPRDATPDERRALESALGAWEQAGVGVRFARLAAGDPGRADVRIDFLEPDETQRAEGTGYTLADCQLAGISRGALQGPLLEARLDRARIRIVRRETTEWDAGDHAWFAGEVAGVALHELAHALGFQGHARFGGGILAADTRESTRVGRALLAGGSFSEPTLRALYALPSGVVLRRVPVPRVRTAPLDVRVASAAGLEGPFVRVGDRSGRIFWRTPGGEELGVTMPSIATARSHPERVVLLPDLDGLRP